MSVVLWNGEYVAEEKATLPFNERGFLFGDGVFTTLLVADAHIFFMEQHLKRLGEDCAAIGIAAPSINPQHLNELVVRNQALKGQWRLKVIATGGRGTSLGLPKQRAGSVIATLAPYKHSNKPLRLKTYSEPLTRPVSKVKSLAYLDRLWLMQYAHDHDCDDVVTQTQDGCVCETAFSNLFWVDGRTLWTPDETLPLLSGLTIRAVKEVARGLSWKVMEGRWHLNEIPLTASVYTCNSLQGIVAVESIDKRHFSLMVEEHRQLSEAYAELARKSAWIVQASGGGCVRCGE